MKLGKVAEMFGCLAYTVRLEILELLEDGKSYSVGEILNEVKNRTFVTLTSSEENEKHRNHRIVEAGEKYLLQTGA